MKILQRDTWDSGFLSGSLAGFDPQFASHVDGIQVSAKKTNTIIPFPRFRCQVAQHP